MFKRKLSALEHPNPEEINLNGKVSFCRVTFYVQQLDLCILKVEEIVVFFLIIYLIH